MAINPHILIIAGTDPTGGAGIVRDIEATAHFAVRASLAITSINVQTNSLVTAIEPVSGQLVKDQMEAAFSTGKIKAIKIGMVATKEIATYIAHSLKNHHDIPVVYDPVFSASSGGALTKGHNEQEISRILLPYVTLLTPNLLELALLSGFTPAQNDEQILNQVRNLKAPVGAYILAKGGHSKSLMSTDILYHFSNILNKKEITIQKFTSPRLNLSMRGTGCTLSSAITANLVLGKTMENSIKNAKDYVYWLIKNS